MACLKQQAIAIKWFINSQSRKLSDWFQVPTKNKIRLESKHVHTQELNNLILTIFVNWLINSIYLTQSSILYRIAFPPTLPYTSLHHWKQYHHSSTFALTFIWNLTQVKGRWCLCMNQLALDLSCWRSESQIQSQNLRGQ